MERGIDLQRAKISRSEGRNTPSPLCAAFQCKGAHMQIWASTSSYPDGSFREFTRWGSADFRRPPEQLQKDLHDNKTSGVNGLGTGQRCERGNSVGSINWKPLKWSCSRSLSSWGSGFSHSSSSKSLGDSGDAAACVIPAAPSGETTPRKKPCLGWGQGLAKYEKKKVECPDKSMNRVEATTSAGSTESSNSMSSNLADKSPRVLRFSDCSSSATPSSVDCGSSPGVEDKSFFQAANFDTDISNLCSSPSLRSQNHPGGSAFSFEKLDTNSVIHLGSSLIDLLQSDDPSTVILCQLPATSSSLPDEENGKTCEEQKIVSVMVHQPTSLKIDNCGNVLREKLPLCNGVLEEVNADVKDGDIDVVSASDNLDTSQLTTMEEVVLVTASSNEGSCTPISAEGSMVKKKDDNAHVPGSLNYDAGRENIVYVEILTPYKELENITDSSIRKRIAMQKQYLRFKERSLSLKAFHHAWNEDMRLLSVRKRHAKSQKKYEFSLCSTDGGYQKHCSSILSHSLLAQYLILEPSTVMINIASKLLLDSNGRLYRIALKMPGLVLDEKEEQVSRFISSNGLVEDPCAAEKERALINPSTSEEKEIFIDKLAAFGKDFRKIASFLDHKTTADCVEFYYKNLKSECFERKKKLDLSKQGKSFMNTYLLTSRKKWSRDFNAASLDVLGAASVITAHAENAMQNQKAPSGRIFIESHCNSRTSQFDDSIAKRSSSSEIIWKDEVAVAADVLAGICGSLSSKAMSSCIIGSADPGEALPLPSTSDVTLNIDDTCSDNSCWEMVPADWLDEEKSVFIQAVLSYGKDFGMISQSVGTSSRDQCKVFFSKARKCLGRDLIHPRTRSIGTPKSSVVCSKKLVSKMEDLPSSIVSMDFDESDINREVSLQTDLNLSDEKNGRLIDHRDSEAVEAMVSDVGQTEPISEGVGDYQELLGRLLILAFLD
ncbi:hypothetical protein ES332_D05G332200v1 [Gossypium tomentosum]|uniref:SANT domain-containing protein n=1 Tax=Gossypium tomentosum TaxID=34277 RepID=A0A5D2L2X7_GOSTO|nr:hypothetical protein ES332_D05G332200v1 [Gossypium tomentosum]